MPFFKIKALINTAYDGNTLIERKDRDKPELIEMVIFTKNKVNAIGNAAKKLAAEGMSHNQIEIIGEYKYANANS